MSNKEDGSTQIVSDNDFAAATAKSVRIEEEHINMTITVREIREAIAQHPGDIKEGDAVRYMVVLEIIKDNTDKGMAKTRLGAMDARRELQQLATQNGWNL